MNATRITERDEFNRTCTPLIRGLHDLAAPLPRYQEVSDPLSYATVLCVTEELRLESNHLPNDELTTTLNQAIVEWLAERD